MTIQALREQFKKETGMSFAVYKSKYDEWLEKKVIDSYEEMEYIKKTNLETETIKKEEENG